MQRQMRRRSQRERQMRRVRINRSRRQKQRQRQRHRQRRRRRQSLGAYRQGKFSYGRHGLPSKSDNGLPTLKGCFWKSNCMRWFAVMCALSVEQLLHASAAGVGRGDTARERVSCTIALMHGFQPTGRASSQLTSSQHRMHTKTSSKQKHSFWVVENFANAMGTNTMLRGQHSGLCHRCPIFQRVPDSHGRLFTKFNTYVRPFFFATRCCLVPAI